MNLKRKIIRLLHLPDWEGFINSKEKWYERERKLGMTPEEEKEFRKKDEKFLIKCGATKYIKRNANE